MSGFNRPKTAEDIGKQINEKFNQEKQKNSTVINGKTYKIIPLKAKDGLIVWENLLALVGPSIGAGLDSMNHNSILDGSPTTFSEALLLLQRKLDGSQLVSYSSELLNGMSCEGVEVDWNEHFSANYGDWVQVIIFAMKENFQTFFTQSGLSLNLQELMSKVLPQPQSTEE